jgi:hypothetical protein
MVVVAADEAGAASRALAPGTEPGAVALLVASTPAEGIPAARLEHAGVRLGPSRGAAAPHGALAAHPTLLPLVADRPADVLTVLEAALPWGGFAKARFLWL